MGTSLAPVRRRVLAGAFIVGITVALLAPVAAYATNTASFSARTPVSGAELTTTRPSISVIVYDRYGVHGSGSYSMTVDGTTVSLSATYLVTGSWNPLHPNYNRLRLSGRPATALAPGTHKITVKIRDMTSRYSTSSWSFTVKAPVAFSTAAPASGSKDDEPRPAISVNAYAFNGAQGSGKFGMTVDGSSITPVVSYSTKYTRFKVAAPALSSDLGLGVHTIVVKVTDLKGNTGSYQWSITVLAPPIVPMPNTVSMSDCAGCHAGYPTAHPMTNCVACHGASAPPRPDGTPMRSYSPIDTSAHTSACAANPVCHRGGGPFPHVLGEDCARCHVGAYLGIPPMHSTSLEQYHQSGSAFCVRSGCHVASLTTEHYRRTVDGVSGGERLSCDTCHKSTDPRVRAAIVSRSTDCEGCHDFTSHTALHTVTRNDTCAVAQCHGSTDTNLITIHDSCAACHADTASATTKNAVLAGNTSCANCHGFLDHRAQHAVTRNDTCAAAECHGSTATDLTAVHTSCTVCHGSDAPAATKAAIAADNRSCANCHGFSDHVTQHAVVRSDACAATACHGSAGTSLTTIHSSCAMCHNSYAPARAKAAIVAGNKDCANCHGFADHKALHAVTRNDTCAASQCHGAADTSLMTIHSSCAVCHGATASDATKAAIAAGNKDCANCHGFTDHTGLHAVVRNDSCAACHVPADTNLITIHKDACATCHGSADDAVKAAISAGRTACGDCHKTHNLPALHAASPASQTITIKGVDYGKQECATCHSSLDLRTLHANNCTTCHSTPVDTTLGGSWTKGCVQGGCHTAGSTRPMHGTVDTSHTVTTWPAKFGGCTTGSCHTGGADVAKIHAPKLGCATCHGGTKVPTLDCGAAGCHETTHDLVGAHAASPASQTITINTVSYGEHGCSECHSPLDLRTLHGGDSSCATCHTTSVGTTLGGSWTKGCVQGGCHTAGSTKPMHPTLTGSHLVTVWPANYDGCTTGTCHTGGADVAKIHAPFLGCATCHGGTKVPTLSCGTVGCHDKVHDLDGAHKASPESQTITINYAPYDGHACSECHSPLDLRTLHGNNCDACHSTTPVDTTLGRTWAKGCAQGNCHAGTSTKPMHPQPALDSAHTMTTWPAKFDGCTTGPSCHTGGNDVAKIHAPIYGCATCHDGKRVTTPTVECGVGGCHDTVHDIVAVHAASPATRTITIKGVPYAGHGCAECHSLDLPTVHSNNCVTCHNPSVKTTLNGLAWDHNTCVEGGCHTLTSTKPMHNPATIDASHTVTTWPARYEGCTTGTCHTGGTDVAAIHDAVRSDGVPAPSCSACHGGKAVPSLNCDTCHGSLDHIAKHDMVRTDDCDGVGCHAGTNVVDVKFTGNVSAHGDCSTCHDPTSTTISSATIAAAIASGHAVCNDCHTDPGHVAKHELTGPTARTDSCIGCHAGTNLTAIQHLDGTVSAVHSTCATCHAPTSTIISAKTISDAIAGGHTECGWCHGTPDHTAKHDILSRDDTCATCHAGTNLTAIQHSDGTVSAVHSTCATCHAPTSTIISAKTISDAIAGGHKDCSYCHGTGHDLRAIHAASPTSQTISIKGVNYGNHECIDCHTVLDLRTIHGGDASCAGCHTTSVKTTLGDGWNKGCVQGGCHAPGTALEMHLSIDTSHTLDYTPSCIGDACHAAGTSGRDVAALHATHGGCAACHDGTRVAKPTLTCASANCHPGVNPPNHTSHPATVSSGIITIGTVSGTHQCSECHATMELQALHGGVSSCIKCHPTARGSFTTWNGTCVQGVCHSSGPLTMHGSLEASHTLASVPSCAAVGSGCHSGGTSVAAIHATHGGCAACHGSGKKPTLVCASCHSSDQLALHAQFHSYCGDCHGQYYNSDHGYLSAEPSTSNCTACHGTVFGSTSVHDQSDSSCDCH